MLASVLAASAGPSTSAEVLSLLELALVLPAAAANLLLALPRFAAETALSGDSEAVVSGLFAAKDAAGLPRPRCGENSSSRRDPWCRSVRTCYATTCRWTCVIVAW